MSLVGDIMRTLDQVINEMENLTYTVVETAEELKEINRLLDNLTEELTSVSLTSRHNTDKLNTYQLKQIEEF